VRCLAQRGLNILNRNWRAQLADLGSFVALNLANEAGGSRGASPPANGGFCDPRAASRCINHELHSLDSASCICRKSTGGFFLQVE
jgi:hypothetical protein